MEYIYLDNAATTKPLKNSLDKAVSFASSHFFNPSAGYREALEVKEELSRARKTLAGLLSCTPEELYFTSCATESNNTVFECGVKNKKGNIVVSAAEHASVYESAVRLKNKGFDVRFAPLTSEGTVDETKFSELVDKDTTLVSVMHASNETGVKNDVKTLIRITKENSRALFHCDGVQAFLKTETDLEDLGVDFYSLSAHKVGGLKGTGLLYIKKGVSIPPFVAGGGQEKGVRSGTENVLGILDFAYAAEEYKEKALRIDIQAMRKIFLDRFNEDWMRVNSRNAENTGYVVSLSFSGIKGEILSHCVEDRGVIIGLGSACSTHVKSHRMFEEMGVPRDFMNGSVRISFSPFNTMEEVKTAADIIYEEAVALRKKING